MTLTGIAKRVHDDILALEDPGAQQLYAAMVLGAALSTDLHEHHPLLQDRLDTVVAKRAMDAREALLRSYVSKRMAGDDVTPEHAAAAVIGKAFDFTLNQRREYARLQDRDERGRYKVMGRDIVQHDPRSALPRRHARQRNIPETEAKDLSGRDVARYQSAYQQVAEMLEQVKGLPAGDAVVHLEYEDAKGERHQSTRSLNRPGKFKLDDKMFKDGGKLLRAEIAVDPSLTVQGAAFDLAGALGTPAANAAGGLFEKDPNGRFYGAKRSRTFADEWAAAGDPGNPSQRIFDRVGSTSRLLSRVAEQVNAPMGVKLALETGDVVSQYGPEAQRVIGPAADRAAYRYRGVERKPDEALTRAIAAVRARNPEPAAARHAMIYGSTITQSTRPGRGGYVGQVPSPVIRYFQDQLPDPELTTLQRKSGTIPPSQGIILDRNGKVVTQAVGYGDDWYLPFNLKTLSRVRGGEYIRTRSWGGLTTEDIYAGLVSGARAVTVVSHNGVYTMELDDSFRGTRRYNDKAARMVKRYGQLLDAVKSKDVVLTDVPDDRLEELRELAEGFADPATENAMYRAELKRLEDAERANPQMAKARRRSIAEEFLLERTGKSYAEGASEYARDYLARVERAGMNMDLARQHTLAATSDPEAYIQAAGLGDQWDVALRSAQDNYRASQSPLMLNGLGYEKAMLALREQFPYYIANAKWSQPRRGGIDYGYVKPQHNRPEGAYAGYYDDSIDGMGKFTADQARHQNGRRRVSANVRVSTEAREPAEAPAARTAAAPHAAALRAQESVLALWDHIRAAATNGTTFASGPAAGSPVAAGIGALKGNMPTVFGMERREFQDYLAREPEKAKEALLVDAAHVRDRNLWAVNPRFVDAVADPEGAAKGKEWNVLGNLDDDFDFGPAYAPGRKPEQYAVEAQRVLRAIGGPEVGASDDEIESWAQKVIDENLAKLRLVGQPGPFRHRREEEFERPIKAAVQVRQLRRRAEAATREADAARQAAEAANPPQDQIAVASIEDFMNRVKELGG